MLLCLLAISKSLSEAKMACQLFVHCLIVKAGLLNRYKVKNNDIMSLGGELHWGLTNTSDTTLPAIAFRHVTLAHTHINITTCRGGWEIIFPDIKLKLTHTLRHT